MLRDAMMEASWEIDLEVAQRLSEIDQLLTAKRELIVNRFEDPETQQEAIDRAEEALDSVRQ